MHLTNAQCHMLHIPILWYRECWTIQLQCTFLTKQETITLSYHTTHQLSHTNKTCCALLALFEGNPPVTGGFPLQRPLARNFHVWLKTNGSANNRDGYLRPHRAHYGVTIMLTVHYVIVFFCPSYHKVRLRISCAGIYLFFFIFLLRRQQTWSNWLFNTLYGKVH